jgi:hypothetical protein
MPNYTLKYLDENYKAVSQERQFTCKNQSEAVLQFAEEVPTSFPFIDVVSFLGGRSKAPNPLATKVQYSQGIAETESLKKILIAAEVPHQLSFTQLELLIENFFLFPTLEKSSGEIYPLREKLYMLSFWNTALQSSLQTRLLSQIASVTSTPQKGNTKANWAPLAAAAALVKLDNIDDSIEGLE